MTAETHLKSDPDFVHREALRGMLRLTANFGGSTLDGMVLGIRKRTRDESGWNAWSSLPDTTQFEIADGRIVDGQFTATLTGTDSNAAAAPEDTVSGYRGGILGEFYGPAAEEVGGVLNASNDDRVMQGAFVGEQTDPNAAPPTGLHRNMAAPVYASSASDTFDDVVDLGTRLSPLTSAVRGDWFEVNSALDDDTYVEQVWVDGDFDAGGKIRIAYVIDGQEQMAEFEAADYDPQNEFERKSRAAAPSGSGPSPVRSAVLRHTAISTFTASVTGAGATLPATGPTRPWVSERIRPTCRPAARPMPADSVPTPTPCRVMSRRATATRCPAI